MALGMACACACCRNGKGHERRGRHTGVALETIGPAGMKTSRRSVLGARGQGLWLVGRTPVGTARRRPKRLPPALRAVPGQGLTTGHAGPAAPCRA